MATNGIKINAFAAESGAKKSILGVYAYIIRRFFSGGLESEGEACVNMKVLISKSFFKEDDH